MDPGPTDMDAQTADTLWLLLCSGLVFLMQPGFMCLESGLTRSKSSINVAIKNLADFGLSVALFWAFGYALMYGTSAGGWLGVDRFFPNLERPGGWPAAFFVFQAMFCGTAVTIVSGAVAERMRFAGYLLVTLLSSGPIYTVFGHWAWNGLDGGVLTGWLGERGFRDFAGATVVHSVGGWVALAAVLTIGPREGRFPPGRAPREIPGHNLPLAILGVFLLWLGWFGFNGGGALTWSDRIPAIVANSMLAAAGGLATTLVAGERLRGRPDVKLAMNGVLAGLVAITGGCHAVSSQAAFAIGAVGGLVMVAASLLLERLEIDDVVGAVPVHAAAGVWGTLAVGLFGDLEVLGTGLGRGAQVAAQGLGAGACFLWTFGAAFLALRLIDRAVPLRVTPEEERQGLNVAEHGATTELLDLVAGMEKQAVSGDLSLRVDVESQSEVGQVAAQYNRVIAALERAMQDLRQGTERYRRTIENALDAIISVDHRGVIVGWNPQAAAIFGWSTEEALGEDVFELVTPMRDRDTTRAGLLSFLATGESSHAGQRTELTCIDRDGREFPVEATFTKAGYGEKLELNLFLQDITERRRAQRVLQRAKEAAEAATRAKSEFLANMSHEIRTPMNGILGITELMLDTELSHQQQQYLEMVRASGDSLLRLLNDILDLSKVEAGKLDVHTLEFGLRDHLADVLRALSFEAAEKQLELLCRIHPEVPDTLLGDPTRLGQIVINLVSNAVKFTARGEVAVEVAVESRGDAHTVLAFAVADTGIGIPKDRQTLIFRVFEQADSSATRKFGGTGLGLAISKRLVETMGGRIWVESEPGRGSTFFFTIRFGLSGEGPTWQRAAARLPRDLRVLVVDDNATSRVVVQEMLAEWELDPTAVADAAAARAELEQALEAGEPYSLILSDVDMPEIDGFSLVEGLRASPRLAAVPVVLMTSRARARDVARCRELGVVAYVLKPIKPSALLETLAGLFAAEGGAEPAPPAALFRPEPAPDLALVVEDNRINRVVARGMLERWGIESVAVASGTEALAALAERPFDLVLMDMHMPDMDGFAVTAAIREMEGSGSHVPIVAMTANVVAEDRERCLEAGMDGYLSKPIERSALAAAVAEAMRLRPAAPVAAPGGDGRPASAATSAFDRDLLLARLDGRPERARRLASIFLEEDGPRHREALARAVAARDAQAVLAAAHALKGATRELCASAASAAVEDLEAAVGSKDFRQIDEMYETLDQEIQVLIENLGAFRRA